jgi:DNA replication and repair protein RecF
MRVSRLALHDFRSYADVDIELSAGAVAFVGANGQGKTNLVEAIGYLATGDSHRVSSDAPLVRVGGERAVVRADVVRGDRTAVLETEITPGKANRARVNGSVLPRSRDLIGVVRAVLFAPEDLALVKGDPSDRRRFLDTLLVMQSPRLAGVRADYERVLRQRNTLLKSARGRNVGLETLDIWDEKLAALGGEIVARRLALLDQLEPFLRLAHGRVTAMADTARQAVNADYAARWTLPAQARETAEVKAAMLAEMRVRSRDERDRGISLVGPHRDEVDLRIGGLPAKGYASHGESWSLALALRLASFELLRADADEDPILILDDVFAELDSDRREQLAGLVGDAEQVLVTAAVAADVPKRLAGERFTVAGGKVTRD